MFLYRPIYLTRFAIEIVDMFRIQSLSIQMQRKLGSWSHLNVHTKYTMFEKRLTENISQTQGQAPTKLTLSLLNIFFYYLPLLDISAATAV